MHLLQGIQVAVQDCDAGIPAPIEKYDRRTELEV